eukprot:COSAG02_NODE_17490_length_999_cov_2.345556_2_plen_138_part_00
MHSPHGVVCLADYRVRSVSRAIYAWRDLSCREYVESMTKGDPDTVVQLHGIVGEMGAVVRGTTPLVELATGSVENLSCIIAVGHAAPHQSAVHRQFHTVFRMLAPSTPVTPCSRACRLGTSTLSHVCLCQRISMGTK